MVDDLPSCKNNLKNTIEAKMFLFRQIYWSKITLTYLLEKILDTNSAYYLAEKF